MYFPIVPNRECIFVGEAIDRLEKNGTIVILARSVDNDIDYQKANNFSVPEKSNLIRL